MYSHKRSVVLSESCGEGLGQAFMTQNSLFFISATAVTGRAAQLIIANTRSETKVWFPGGASGFDYCSERAATLSVGGDRIAGIMSFCIADDAATNTEGPKREQLPSQPLYWLSWTDKGTLRLFVLDDEGASTDSSVPARQRFHELAVLAPKEADQGFVTDVLICGDAQQTAKYSATRVVLPDGLGAVVPLDTPAPVAVLTSIRCIVSWSGTEIWLWRPDAAATCAAGCLRSKWHYVVLPHPEPGVLVDVFGVHSLQSGAPALVSLFRFFRVAGEMVEEQEYLILVWFSSPGGIYCAARCTVPLQSRFVVGQGRMAISPSRPATDGRRDVPHGRWAPLDIACSAVY